MIGIESSGSTKRTEDFLLSLKNMRIRSILEDAGAEGVRALAAATPKDSGRAASSWYYKVEQTKTGVEVAWYNSDVENGFPVVIALQYGHGTGNGGFVPGRDYINPALKPIFDRISNNIRKAVK